jgi:hypothetical protein
MSNWSNPNRAADDTESSPPPIAPTAAVATILEQFFAWDQALTAELLAQLARCSASDLAKLFDCKPAPPATADGENGSRPPAAEPESGPKWGYSGPELSGALQAQATDPKSWSWDSNGRRITKLPSSFPRQSYDRPRRPPGATWMSD